MKFLPLILRNLLRNKRRTLLTILSIAVSVLVFASLMSLPSLVNQIMRDRTGSLRLVSYSKGGGFFYSLPAAYRRRIEAIDHVEAVSGEMIFMGTYRDPKDLIPSVALDAERIEDIWPDWGITKRSAEEFRKVRSGALVGTTLMKRFGWKPGDLIMLHGTIFPIDIQLKVVGILSGSSASVALIFRRDDLDEVLGRPGTVNLFWVKVDRSQSIPAVIDAIDRSFANSPAETKTESELAVSQSRLGSAGLLLNGAKVLALIVICSIALVAANTASMSVRERRHEFAVMRSIGFTRKLILSCILCEGLAIGITAGILGCAAAWLGLHYIPYASRTLGLIALILRLPRRVILESLLVAGAIGLASTLVPAGSAVRGDASSGLRAIV